MKVAVLCSAGGAAFEEAVKAFSDRIDFYLITDRECAAENIASKYCLKSTRIEDPDNKILSMKIFNYCKIESISILVTYFSRIIHEPLLSKIDCYNVHPSILPKYPGMGAEKKAYENKDDLIGATMHKIDSGIDTGAVLFQSSLNVGEDKSLERYKKLSYICKTKVTYCFFEKLLKTGPYGFDCDFIVGAESELFSQTLKKKNNSISRTL